MDIHQQLVEFIDAGRACVLAVILKAEGHTPQKSGVKAIIEADGKIRGTLGGGIVEGKAQRLAGEVCRTGQARVFDFDLADAYAREAGPICGGFMRILLDPGAGEQREIYAQAAEALRQRRRGALLTRVSHSSPVKVAVEWHERESVPEGLGFPGAEAVRSCLERETAFLFEAKGEAAGGMMEVLVEPVIPRPRLVIAGGGHVGQALARLGNFNGFDVTVIDDRPEFAQAALFGEGVSTRCGKIANEVAALTMDRDSYVVIVTRGHKDDAETLEACIHAPAAYVGMIGSRRKVAMIRNHFIESGLATEAEFARVFAPVGLEIGAVTVPEIATSIMAQVIAVRRKGAAHSGGGMVRP